MRFYEEVVTGCLPTFTNQASLGCNLEVCKTVPLAIVSEARFGNCCKHPKNGLLGMGVAFLLEKVRLGEF